MFAIDIWCYPLSKKITLLIGSILLINIVTAHKCYVCGPNSNDIYFNGELIPTCVTFDFKDSKFIKNCDTSSKGCSIQTNGTIVTRACEDLQIQDCKKANKVEYCYCIEDLCNKYHPTHMDEEVEEEGSGVTNEDVTSTKSSIEPGHVTESIRKHSSSYCKNQADITLIFAIIHIGKNILLI